jgi:hypothetical protein
MISFLINSKLPPADCQQCTLRSAEGVTDNGFWDDKTGQKCQGLAQTMPRRFLATWRAWLATLAVAFQPSGASLWSDKPTGLPFPPYALTTVVMIILRFSYKHWPTIKTSKLNVIFKKLTCKGTLRQVFRSPKFIRAPSRDVHSFTHWTRPPQHPLKSPRIRPLIQGRYWSAKIDDISL